MKWINKAWLLAVAGAAIIVVTGLYLTVFRIEQPARDTMAPADKALTSQQLSAMLPTKDFTFINTHVPYEGEISQTDLFIPYESIESNLDKLPADKTAKIVVYCQTGRMSRIAAESLALLGYKNVYDVTGGMEAWQAAGYPLIQKGRET